MFQPGYEEQFIAQPTLVKERRGRRGRKIHIEMQPDLIPPQGCGRCSTLLALPVLGGALALASKKLKRSRTQYPYKYRSRTSGLPSLAKGTAHRYGPEYERPGFASRIASRFRRPTTEKVTPVLEGEEGFRPRTAQRVWPTRKPEEGVGPSMTQRVWPPRTPQYAEQEGLGPQYAGKEGLGSRMKRIAKKGVALVVALAVVRRIMRKKGATGTNREGFAKRMLHKIWQSIKSQYVEQGGRAPRIKSRAKKLAATLPEEEEVYEQRIPYQTFPSRRYQYPPQPGFGGGLQTKAMRRPTSAGVPYEETTKQRGRGGLLSKGAAITAMGYVGKKLYNKYAHKGKQVQPRREGLIQNLKNRTVNRWGYAPEREVEEAYVQPTKRRIAGRFFNKGSRYQEETTTTTTTTDDEGEVEIRKERVVRRPIKFGHKGEQTWTSEQPSLRRRISGKINKSYY